MFNSFAAGAIVGLLFLPLSGFGFEGHEGKYESTKVEILSSPVPKTWKMEIRKVPGGHDVYQETIWGADKENIAHETWSIRYTLKGLFTAHKHVTKTVPSESSSKQVLERKGFGMCADGLCSVTWTSTSSKLYPAFFQTEILQFDCAGGKNWQVNQRPDRGVTGSMGTFHRVDLKPGECKK